MTAGVFWPTCWHHDVVQLRYASLSISEVARCCFFFSCFFFIFLVRHEIWSCSKSTLGQRKSAWTLWLSCRCFVMDLQEKHTFLINAVLIVKNTGEYREKKISLLSHFKEEGFTALCKFPKIVKILKWLKSHVVAVHFLAFIMRTGANKWFCPFTNIQALDPLNKNLIFSSVTYGFEEL